MARAPNPDFNFFAVHCGLVIKQLNCQSLPLAPLDLEANAPLVPFLARLPMLFLARKELTCLAPQQLHSASWVLTQRANQSIVKSLRFALFMAKVPLQV